ncbi:MAG: serine/threonine protein kinase [Planctomycetia bacterium]|nr:serine/threonine protein kinase [Planctomycetia bacterium]
MSDSNVENLIQQYRQQQSADPQVTVEEFCHTRDCQNLVEKIKARLQQLDLQNKNPAEPVLTDELGLSSNQDAGKKQVQEVKSTTGSQYRLLHVLGEGGMGAVWLAEQTEPVRRRVAIKLIKPGMDSKGVLARFEIERQALAMMDHPNIAKVYDAGTISDGRPFFVMELVKGIPINDFCNQAKLNIEERLKLFSTVCSAIQHAHQKGIIHRDLKPSNVLVALYDGKPLVKVIDFGVAKALHHNLTQRTIFTEVGVIIGTLEYMSPEQAELTNLDIDTRTDIYSLGCILYELLTDSRPIDGKVLRSAGFTEMLRLIREKVPDKPSTKLSQSGEKLPSISAQRRLEPKRLTKMIAGDLDWIVMKALAKERDRRYDTATAFADDIQRFLNNEVVQAGPPTLSYRLSKFILRNRQQVLAGALVVLALIAGLISSLVFMRQAQAHALEEEIAQEKAQRSEAAARDSENKVKQAMVARMMAESIMGSNDDDPLFINPSSFGQNRKLLDSLRASEAKAQRELSQDLFIYAAVLQMIGNGYRTISMFPKAESLLLQSLELKKKILPNDHADLGTCLMLLGLVHTEQGKTRAAEVELTQAYEILKKSFSEEDVILQNVQLYRSYVAIDAEDYPEAERRLREIIDGQDQKGQKDSYLKHRATLALGSALTNQGKILEALKLCVPSLNRLAVKAGYPKLVEATSAFKSGATFLVASQHDLALKQFQTCRSLLQSEFGPDHAYEAILLFQMAKAYSGKKNYTQAQQAYEDSLRIMRLTVGFENYNAGVVLQDYAEMLNASQQPLGRVASAFEEYELAQRKRWSAEHFRTANALLLHAQFLKQYQKPDAMNKKLEEAMAIYRMDTKRHASKIRECEKLLQR